ncbi:hypothetical protein AB4Y40_16210 [Paraburkholderia sp. EG287B]|uniref:hypothetical protein n=1 Tax=Paraburkholderia sp. EG287B TaxID=3237010 RepID=UPI0034D31619
MNDAYAKTDAMLRAFSAEHGIRISSVQEVSEVATAALLGLPVSTLRQQVAEGRAPVRPSSIHGIHRRYRFDDIVAAHVAAQRRALDE